MKEYTLPEGWKYVPLGTIADVINGVSFKPEDVKKQGIRILRSGNIQNGYLVLKDDDVFLDDSYYNEKNTLRYLDNCITASTGSIEVLGKCGTVFKEMPNCQIGAFMRLVRSKAKENAFYISFILHSPLYYQYIRRLSKNGTSINNINNNHLEDFIFPLPPQKLKEGISRWYYSIEKKISLNTRMNAELEAMAKQLYDYWFVQFDFPDENGKPYKSSGGKMVWNEKLKREIPEGWEDGTIGELFDTQAGYAFKSSEWKEFGHPVLTIKNIQDDGSVSFVNVSYIDKYDSKLEKYSADNGNMVFAMSGNTIGKVGIISSNISKVLINQRVLIIKTNTNNIAFPYFVITDKKIQNLIFQLGANSAQPNISENEFRNIKICLPPKFILNFFNKRYRYSFEKIIINRIEITALTHLRDSLLPMLMNGQVTIE